MKTDRTVCLMLRVIIAAVAVSLSSAHAMGATIKVRTGTTLSGEISGWVALKREVTEPDKGFAYLLVEGKHVSAIDEKGVHLAKGIPVRALFVAGADLMDLSPLGVAYRFGKSFDGQMVARLSVGGGCCLISTIYADALTDQLLGEFRGDTAGTPIVAALEIAMTGSKSVVPVSDIVPFQNVKGDVLAWLAGTWSLESGGFGAGFISSSFPGPNTPPTVIPKQGNSVSFRASLQTDQGSAGQPINDDFVFMLTQTGADYSLSIESKSWLATKEIKLSAKGDFELAGTSRIPVGGEPASLSVTIRFTPPSGHAWELAASGPDGRLLRRIRMTFKPQVVGGF